MDWRSEIKESLKQDKEEEVSEDKEVVTEEKEVVTEKEEEADLEVETVEGIKKGREKYYGIQ